MPPRLSAESVVGIIRDAIGTEVSGLMPLRPGAWSTVYAFRAEGRHYVIRFSETRDDFERDRFARSFNTATLPIPRVVAIGTIDAMHYAISERAPGTFLDDLDADGMRLIFPSLLHALDAMRTADTSATSGFGVWREGGDAPYPAFASFLASVVADSTATRDRGWRERLASSSVVMGPFDECYREMMHLLDGVPEYRHIVHADLLNFNVLVDRGAITGVIDWGCAFYGDHLYDVAWFAFWSPWYPQWHDLDLTSRMLAFFRDAGADMEHAEQRLRCYMLHIGLGQMRYSASIERWDTLEAEASRTLSIARRTLFTLNETA